MRALALLLLVGFLVVTPPAGGQAPLQDVCGPIEATSVAPGAMLEGETKTATLTVLNKGRTAIRATASLDIQQAGWEFQADAKGAILVQPGQSGTFSFAITATEAATEGATANFLARGTCEPQSGTACPTQVCTPQEATSSQTIALRQAEGLDIPFLQNLAFPPEYLVASVALVGIVGAIVVLARKPARGLAADCPEPLKLVRPGRGASFPIELRNPSSEPATAELEVGAVPEGWSAFMPVPDVQLAPRESRSLFLMVRAPPAAVEGDAVDVELKVRPSSTPGKVAHVRVRAEVNEGVAGAE